MKMILLTLLLSLFTYALTFQFNQIFNKISNIKTIGKLFKQLNNKPNVLFSELIDRVDQIDSTPKDPPETFSWTKQWYPIAVSEYTDKTKPNELDLLGNKVVLWYDGNKWNTFADVCPHRGVPLSQGRVEKNGELLCAYHAWTFDNTGKCTNIPQVDEKIKESLLENTKTCAIVYPTQELQGLIWVWGEGGRIGSNVSLEAALKSPQLVEELSDPQYKDRVIPYKYGFRHIPYGWDMFMENVQDPAHVPVAHHNIVGSRYKDAEPFTLERTKSLTEIPKEEGGLFDPAFPSDVGYNHIVKYAKPKETISTFDFRPPTLNKIVAEYPSGARTLLVLYATPTKPGYCKHIGTNILIKGRDGSLPAGLGLFAKPLPTWFLHALASTFLHQDMVFLHQQERMLYHDTKYAFGDFQNQINVSSDPKLYFKNYLLNEADRSISTLRKWIYNQAGGGPKWGPLAIQNGLPKRLSDDELFNVYDYHTKDCVVCKKALENFTKIKFASLFGALLSVVLLKGWRAILASTLFTGFSYLCHKFSSLYLRYSFAHQDNN